MIYLFTGSDVNKVRAKAFQWVAAARAKAPDAPYVRLTADSLEGRALRDALSAQGLFFSKTLVVLDDPFSSSDGAELVLGMLKELADSKNIVAIIAPKLLAARSKKVEALAEKIFVSDAPKKVERGFNTGLVNALAAKDAAALWKEVVNALRQGDAPEMVHGLMHWKARDLLQKGSRTWTRDEARRLSRDLIMLVADSRGRDLPLNLALERFALSIY